MTLEIALVLGLLVVAVILLGTEVFSVDVSALLLVILMVMFGILTPQEAFSGFASEIVIVLCSIFVVSQSLLKTGVLDWVADALLRLGGKGEKGPLAAVMGFTAFISAFMNNTTATAVFMPGVVKLAMKRGVSPSRFLLPLAFAAILGGTCTLIGTSTNVAVSGFLERQGLEPFSLFAFAGVGLTLVVTGILFFLIFGQRLLPERPFSDLTDKYQVGQYLGELRLNAGSPLLGIPLKESPLAGLGISVLRIRRAGIAVHPDAETVLAEGDELLVEGDQEGLLAVREIEGVEIVTEGGIGDEDLAGGEVGFVEALVPPRSLLLGRSIVEAQLRRRFGATALAVHHREHLQAPNLRDFVLSVGDLLLLLVPKARIRQLASSPDLWLFREHQHVPFLRRKGLLVLVSFGLALLLVGLGILPLSVGFLLAALSTLVFRCISSEEAYKFIEWRLIILIAAMTSFGVAMQKTGADHYLASWIVNWAAPLGVTPILAGFAILTVLLTQPLSNAAAALVVLPMALSTAQELGINPQAVAAMVTISASVSFIAPFEPSCLLVYGVGNYRFSDFVRVGLPLTLIDIVLILLLVPVFWPL